MCYISIIAFDSIENIYSTHNSNLPKIHTYDFTFALILKLYFAEQMRQTVDNNVNIIKLSIRFEGHWCSWNGFVSGVETSHYPIFELQNEMKRKTHVDIPEINSSAQKSRIHVISFYIWFCFTYTTIVFSLFFSLIYCTQNFKYCYVA